MKQLKNLLRLALITATMLSIPAFACNAEPYIQSNVDVSSHYPAHYQHKYKHKYMGKHKYHHKHYAPYNAGYHSGHGLHHADSSIVNAVVVVPMHYRQGYIKPAYQKQLEAQMQTPNQFNLQDNQENNDTNLSIQPYYDYRQ